MQPTDQKWELLTPNEKFDSLLNSQKLQITEAAVAFLAAVTTSILLGVNTEERWKEMAKNFAEQTEFPELATSYFAACLKRIEGLCKL